MKKFCTTTRNKFLESGFVCLQDFQPQSRIEEITANMNRVIEWVVPTLPAEHVFYEDKSNKSSLKQIQQLNKHDGFFGKLMSAGPFRELAGFLLGGPVRCENLQYFNKPAGTQSATPAHQDGYYFKLSPCEALTMWLPLESVDEENGCIRYVSGSHRRGLRPHAKTNTLGFSLGITDFPGGSDSEDEVTIPVKPGDLLVHHALTIHRADRNRSQHRSRRALGFIYYSSRAKCDVAARDRYKQELLEELVNGNRI